MSYITYDYSFKQTQIGAKVMRDLDHGLTWWEIFQYSFTFTLQSSTGTRVVTHRISTRDQTLETQGSIFLTARSVRVSEQWNVLEPVSKNGEFSHSVKFRDFSHSVKFRDLPQSVKFCESFTFSQFLWVFHIQSNNLCILKLDLTWYSNLFKCFSGIYSWTNFLNFVLKRTLNL